MIKIKVKVLWKKSIGLYWIIQSHTKSSSTRFTSLQAAQAEASKWAREDHMPTVVFEAVEMIVPITNTELMVLKPPVFPEHP